MKKNGFFLLLVLFSLLLSCVTKNVATHSDSAQNSVPLFEKTAAEEALSTKSAPFPGYWNLSDVLTTIGKKDFESENPATAVFSPLYVGSYYGSKEIEDFLAYQTRHYRCK